MAVTIRGSESVQKVVWAWTSSAGGAFTEATTVDFHGKILGFATIPAGGGDAPTDNYDITITDADGHDVLLGGGANRDEANTEYVAGTACAGVASSARTLNVANAGNAKSGTAILWIG